MSYWVGFVEKIKPILIFLSMVLIYSIFSLKTSYSQANAGIGTNFTAPGSSLVIKNNMSSVLENVSNVSTQNGYKTLQLPVFAEGPPACSSLAGVFWVTGASDTGRIPYSTILGAVVNAGFSGQNAYTAASVAFVESAYGCAGAEYTNTYHSGPNKGSPVLCSSTSGANAGLPSVDVSYFEINTCQYSNYVTCTGPYYDTCSMNFCYTSAGLPIAPGGSDSSCNWVSLTDPKLNYQIILAQSAADAFAITNSGTNTKAWRYWDSYWKGAICVVYPSSLKCPPGPYPSQGYYGTEDAYLKYGPNPTPGQFPQTQPSAIIQQASSQIVEAPSSGFVEPAPSQIVEAPYTGSTTAIVGPNGPTGAVVVGCPGCFDLPDQSVSVQNGANGQAQLTVTTPTTQTTYDIGPAYPVGTTASTGGTPASTLPPDCAQGCLVFDPLFNQQGAQAGQIVSVGKGSGTAASQGQQNIMTLEESCPGVVYSPSFPYSDGNYPLTFGRLSGGNVSQQPTLIEYDGEIGGICPLESAPTDQDVVTDLGLTDTPPALQQQAVAYVDDLEQPGASTGTTVITNEEGAVVGTSNINCNGSCASAPDTFSTCSDVSVPCTDVLIGAPAQEDGATLLSVEPSTEVTPPGADGVYDVSFNTQSGTVQIDYTQYPDGACSSCDLDIGSDGSVLITTDPLASLAGSTFYTTNPEELDIIDNQGNLGEAITGTDTAGAICAGDCPILGSTLTEVDDGAGTIGDSGITIIGSPESGAITVPSGDVDLEFESSSGAAVAGSGLYDQYLAPSGGTIDISTTIGSAAASAGVFYVPGQSDLTSLVGSQVEQVTTYSSNLANLVAKTNPNLDVIQGLSPDSDFICTDCATSLQNDFIVPTGTDTAGDYTADIDSSDGTVISTATQTPAQGLNYGFYVTLPDGTTQIWFGNGVTQLGPLQSGGTITSLADSQTPIDAYGFTPTSNPTTGVFNSQGQLQGVISGPATPDISIGETVQFGLSALGFIAPKVGIGIVGQFVIGTVGVGLVYINGVTDGSTYIGQFVNPGGTGILSGSVCGSGGCFEQGSFLGQLGSLYQTLQPVFAALGLLNFAVNLFGGGTVKVPLPPQTISTSFNSLALPVSITNSSPLTVSPTSQVSQNNYNNASNFLTCPTPASEVHPMDDLYFYANKGSGVAGDECLAPTASFNSVFYNMTTIMNIPAISEYALILASLGNGGWVNDVTQLLVVNPGNTSVQEITYSPMVDGLLSNGFSTQSYIFDGVPSFAQHEIWSWNTVFANFASVQSKSQTFSTSIDDIEPPYCLYSGTYEEVTTLKSVNTNYIPFQEVQGTWNPDSAAGRGISADQGTINTIAYPLLSSDYFLTLNSSEQALNPNLTNIVEDTYSPWSYYNVYNSIDQFPIDLAGQFFANSSNTPEADNILIGLSVNGILGIDTNSVQVPVSTYPANTSNSGPVPPSNGLMDPISITGGAYNYFFALYGNETAGYNIAILRVYPHGYYNTLNIPLPPGDATCGGSGSWTSSSCQGAWLSQWSAYWSQVINMQNNSAYIERIVPLTSMLTGFGINFQPYNISTDDDGDLFIIGSSSTSGQAQQSMVVKITNVTIQDYLCAGSSNCDQLSFNSLPSETSMPTEIAVSPSIGNIYLASPSSGNILVFSGNTFAYLSSIPLTYSGYTAIGGTSLYDTQLNSNSISNAAGSMLNITGWLLQGGLFGATGLVTSSASQDYDSIQYHHPVGIQDIGGYIYVLDDWSGEAGVTPFNILTLRVINSTGADVPINPSMLNDLSPEVQPDPFASESGATIDFPPYGWIISATVGATSFCSSSSCTYNPGNLDGPYYPVGSEIGENSCSTTCNGIDFSLNFNNTASIFMQDTRGAFSYNEILIADLNIQNYTQLFNNTPTYQCYTSPGITSSCVQYPTLGLLSPPIYMVEDPFTYLENQGSQKLLSFSSAFSSAFANGSGSPISQSGLSQQCLESISQFQFVGCSNLSPSDLESINGELQDINAGNVQYSYETNSVASAYAYDYNSTPEASNIVITFNGPTSGISTQNAITISLVGMSIGTVASNTVYAEPGAFEEQQVTYNSPMDGISDLTANFYNISYITLSGLTPDEDGLEVYVTQNYAANVLGSSPSAGITDQISSAAIAVVTPIFPPITPVNFTTPAAPTLQSVIAGNVLVGYSYTYETQQLWGPFVLINSKSLGFPTSLCLPALPPILSTNDYTTYAYAPTPTTVSNLLSAKIEGGDTYLKYQQGQNYYIPSLSDPSLYLSQHLLFNVTNNRQFGRAYAASAGSSDTYQVLNATLQKQYLIYTTDTGNLLNSSIIESEPDYNSVIYSYSTQTMPSRNATDYNATSATSNITVVFSQPEPWISTTNSLTLSITGNSIGAIASSTANAIPGPIETQTETFTSDNNETSSGFTANFYNISSITFNGLIPAAEGMQVLILETYQNLSNPNPSSDFSPCLPLLLCNDTDQISAVGTANVTANYTYLYGPQYSGTDLSNAIGTSYFSYGQNSSMPPYFGSVSLFNWYKEEAYESQLELYTPDLYGYQRILYALNDRFNNTLYAPLDIDITNQTQLSFGVTPTVDPLNPNQTSFTVAGNLSQDVYNGLGNVIGYQIPLTNANVFIYIEKDINYLGLDTEQSQLCAFGSPSYPYNTIPFPSNCIIANPSFTALEQGSDTVNYAPQYNSIGMCSQPSTTPNSVLASNINCNIYGMDDKGNLISATCPLGADNQQMYCSPTFLNGSGTCTSQLGLVSVVQTNTLGSFSYNTIACGVGTYSMEAEYYGNPGQPTTVTQPPLSSSAQSVQPIELEPTTQAADNGGNLYARPSDSSQFTALNYYWSPAQSYYTFQTGYVELSFGNLGLLEICLTLAFAIILISILQKGRKSGS